MRLTSSDVESVNIAICTTFHESCPHCKHCEVWDWTQFFEKLTREKWVIQWTRHFHKWVDQLAMHQFGPSECSVQPTQKKEKQWLSWCSQCGFSQPSKGFCTFWQELLPQLSLKKGRKCSVAKVKLLNFWSCKGPLWWILHHALWSHSNPSRCCGLQVSVPASELTSNSQIVP